MTERQRVDDFLAQHRIALVGYAHKPDDFSHAVWKELATRGYELVAVNPHPEGIEGVEVHATVGEITPPVDAALLMTPPGATAAAVRDCVEAGIRRIWIHRGAGQGSVSAEAVRACEEAGIEAVVGHCPLMFLGDAAWYHRVHGWFKKVGGSWPAEA